MTTFGSVCSGIEAASVAWSPLGWQAAWFAEIEPFPCAVLAHHYPNVPNLGDMSALPAAVRAGRVAAPDILCGGTPCQAFSVAGLRRSLDDARGNLSLVFCELADAIDSVRTVPAIIFWENVPGVLSTADNAFGCFLAGLAGEDDALVAPGGKWADAGYVLGPQRAVAWRILDAQYFGLAQRRRRVFVVASARNDFDPVAVLLEFDGVRRDSAPSREAGEGAAGTLAGGARKRGGYSTDDVPAVIGPLAAAHGPNGHGGSGLTTNQTIDAGHPLAFGGNNTSGSIDVAAAVNAHGGSGRMDFESETFVTHALRGEGFDASEDGTGRGTPPVPCVYDTTQITSAANRSRPEPGDPSHPLAAGAHAPLLVFHADAQPDQMRFDTNTSSSLTCGQRAAVAFSSKDYGADATTDLSPTLRAMNHADSHANGGGQMAVAFDTYNQTTSPTAHTLRNPNGTFGDALPATFNGMQVRRLTPRECERLQGFPDDYTLIPYRGKPASDGPRYKALGNSWAVPVVRWIGARIAIELNGCGALLRHRQ